MHGGPLPLHLLFQLLPIPRHFPWCVQVQSAGTFNCLHCQLPFVSSFDKNAIWGHYNAFASDFTSVVLIRTSLSEPTSFSLPMSSLFCFSWERSVVPTLPLNWIQPKIVSAAVFCTTGLAKIPRIECLPLDWIYHSNDSTSVLLCNLMC